MATTAKVNQVAEQDEDTKDDAEQYKTDLWVV
jgi:hypothetical protein